MKLGIAKYSRKYSTKQLGSMWPNNAQNATIIKDNVNSNESYLEMLKKVFMGELKANEKYRELLAYAPNKQIYSMLFYIFADELKHANLYNYLISLNAKK